MKTFDVCLTSWRELREEVRFTRMRPFLQTELLFWECSDASA